MNNDDMDYILGTERCQSLSVLCMMFSLVFLVAHEFKGVDFIARELSSAPGIVLAIIAVALRVMAIDRFLRMNRQKDYEEKHLNIES